MANLLQFVKTYDDFKEAETKPKTAKEKPGASAAPFPKFEEAIQPATPQAQAPQTVAPPHPAASSAPPAAPEYTTPDPSYRVGTTGVSTRARRLGSRYEQVAQIAHQVYERLDGSGYPKGLQGDEILPEARILGTVDFFESFAHPRPYKTTLPGTANHGIQMLMQMADKFGAATLKALVGSIGLFPIGSYVRLSSGEIGRVVDVKKENLMRPEVEVLLDGGRRPPRDPRTLDLLALPHIYVSRALTASDLRELGLLPPPSEMPKLAKLENGHS